MINKKAWEKSFRKVNGREPNEKEYQKAVLNGLVKGPDEKNNSPKKTYVIIGIIIGAFLLIIITFVSTLLLFPAPKSNHTESFNTGSTESVASSSSSSQSSSSDTSQQDLTTWQNLTLNEQIALLAQSYTAINLQISLLNADKIAMTANGDKGVNDGFIQWYDATNNLHRLDVLINDETISFSYIGNTGQSERKKDKISSILSTYFQTNTAKQTTETLALKMVTPVELYQSNISEKDLDITAISNGDISSLVGSWENGHGDVITINSDHSVSSAQSGQQASTNFKIAPKGSESRIPHIGAGPDAPAIGGFVFALFKIGFKNPYGDRSDIKRPRIIGTQSEGNYAPEAYYYRK
ncbi:hypothetical protein RU86_GL000746 [Lactococcus piscium]|uniref:DUF6287 domain-containing protein n=1 Tax=Pseudolactococcus piscium TaxID=1364 RepID=A0A2A5RWG1_9LACT|nr:DUF6287 domain-containing protein [Lactococcus piscium]PCS05534.1 hypothetical protein RU86_GL000746 [Lactococcus piscium]